MKAWGWEWPPLQRTELQLWGILIIFRPPGPALEENEIEVSVQGDPHLYEEGLTP